MFAKDWPGLQQAWLDYEAKDYKDSKLTAFAAKVDAATAKYQGGKTPIETLSQASHKPENLTKTTRIPSKYYGET